MNWEPQKIQAKRQCHRKKGETKKQTKIQYDRRRNGQRDGFIKEIERQRDKEIETQLQRDRVTEKRERQRDRVTEERDIY